MKDTIVGDRVCEQVRDGGGKDDGGKDGGMSVMVESGEWRYGSV